MEAVIAIAIYSIVAVLALASMNSGLKSAQKNLESTMSRAAVDSQVDAIRYIYDGYIKSKSGGGKDADYFKDLWKTLANNYLVEVSESGSMTLSKAITDPDKASSCGELISNDVVEGSNSKVFALNPRAFASEERLNQDMKDPSALNGLKFKDGITRDKMINYVIIPYNPGNIPTVATAPLYPRITYKTTKSSTGSEEELSNMLIGGNAGGDTQPTRDALKAEGVWVDLIHEEGKDAYDVYVRTCWNAAGEKAPTTFTTVVRLYKVD